MTTEYPETIAAPTTPVLDTVEVAATTPEKEQPYAALGLKPDEYERIRNILGRRPTSARDPCARSDSTRVIPRPR